MFLNRPLASSARIRRNRPDTCSYFSRKRKKMFFDWRQSHARSRNRILLKSSPSPRPSCRIEQSQNGEITRSLGHVRQNCPAEPINNKNCREKKRERERERSFHERTEANVNPITRFPCNRCSASSACPEGESSCCK